MVLGDGEGSVSRVLDLYWRVSRRGRVGVRQEWGKGEVEVERFRVFLDCGCSGLLRGEREVAPLQSGGAFAAGTWPSSATHRWASPGTASRIAGCVGLESSR